MLTEEAWRGDCFRFVVGRGYLRQNLAGAGDFAEALAHDSKGCGGIIGVTMSPNKNSGEAIIRIDAGGSNTVRAGFTGLSEDTKRVCSRFQLENLPSWKHLWIPIARPQQPSSYWRLTQAVVPANRGPTHVGTAGSNLRCFPRLVLDQGASIRDLIGIRL